MAPRHDSVYATRRGGPKLVRSAVLFVDLLGVRAMNRGRETDVRRNLIALEHDVAIHPRIVLSKDAEASQRNDLFSYAAPAESPQNAMLLRDGDGRSFINYLALLLDESDDPRPALALHRDQIGAQLTRHRAHRRVWEKYRWTAEYHNNVVGRRLPAEPGLLVDASAMTWQFTPFVEERGPDAA